MSCATTIYANIDLVMLGFAEDNYIVGGYSIVERIKAILTVTGGLIWTITLPRASALWEQKRTKEFEELAGRSINLVLFIQIPVMLLTFMFYHTMIRAVAGYNYLFAAPALFIMAFAILPIAISNIIGGQVLIPAKLEKQLLTAELIGAAVNILLNAIFIPLYGMEGAAFTTVIAEVIVMALTIIAVAGHLHIHIFRWREIATELISAELAVAITRTCCHPLLTMVPYFLFVLIEFVIILLLYLAGLLLFRNETLNRLFLQTVVVWVTRIKQRKFPVGSHTGMDWTNAPAPSPDKPFICPCCENAFTDLLYGSYHLQPRVYKRSLYHPHSRHVICPQCRSFPRHRLLTYYLEMHKEDIQKCSSILYFANEPSVENWFNRNEIKYTTADLVRPADLQLNIEETGLEGTSQDLIICNHVLEHVENFNKGLAELHRILKDNGLLIISFPIDRNLPTYVEDLGALSVRKRIRRFGQKDHLRIFGTDSKEILEKAGFEVEELTGDHAPEVICMQDGPADYDLTLLFLCRKRHDN